MPNPKRPSNNLSYIKDYKQRVTTYSKRKRSLFKKAIELSMLCDLDVFLVIFDKQKQKFFELNSSKQFSSQIVSSLLSEITRLQFISKRYTNSDHLKFCIDKAGRDSGPEDEEASAEESEDEVQDKAEHFQDQLSKYIIPELQTLKHRERYEFMKQSSQQNEDLSLPQLKVSIDEKLKELQKTDGYCPHA